MRLLLRIKSSHIRAQLKKFISQHLPCDPGMVLGVFAFGFLPSRQNCGLTNREEKVRVSGIDSIAGLAVECSRLSCKCFENSIAQHSIA
jgi:hypothetical protein